MYLKRLKDLREAGIRIKKSKSPTPGQKQYVKRIWDVVIPSHSVTVKLTKPQENYFRKIGAKVYKNKLIVPLEGAIEVKIQRDGKVWNIARRKDKYFETRTVAPLPDERIDDAIIRTLKKLKKNEQLFVGVEGNNTFKRTFTDVSEFLIYVNNFGSRYQLSRADEDAVITHLQVVRVTPRGGEWPGNLNK